MIGNDIVDRAQAKRDSNWQRKGFLAKLFTPSEQQLIQTASDPECMVWTLWSMKESAYKATTRQTGARVFNPTKISCTLETWCGETADGFVVYEEKYHVKSLITPEWIANIAFPVDSLPIPEQVIIPLKYLDYQYQSAQLRTSVLEYCTTVFPVWEKGLRISSDKNGSPVLVIQNSPQESTGVPISISHHGSYGAFCIAHSGYMRQD